MQMNIDPEWLKKMAEREDGCIVSVGGLVTEMQRMAETRLTEHVWQGEDGRLEWQVAPGGFTYRQGDTAGWDAACELAQALLAERERVERLRAALERQADFWEAESEYYNDAPELRRNRINRAQAIRQALREDGEEKPRRRLPGQDATCDGDGWDTVEGTGLRMSCPGCEACREDGESGNG